MPVLTAFTTYDSVRAVIGVSDEELEDATLAEVIYYVQLSEKLLSLSSTMETDFLTLPGSPSAAQIRFGNLVKTYSAYFIASLLLGALPMFAPKAVKDSQEGFTRIDDPYKNIGIDVNFALGQLQTLLEAAYAVVLGVGAKTVTPRVMQVSTGLAVDPVTGV